MIEVKNLKKVYGKDTVAVDDISFAVKKGEIFGFLGPNGAGKSTTIKSIVGLIKPTSGEIKVSGYDTITNPIRAKMSLGYVADEPLIMEKLTGAEYLNFIGNIFEVPPKLKMERTEKLSEYFKISKALKDTVGSYSHGMRQKLSLTAALLHNPPVWILDEPIVGLDPESSYIIKKMMRNHADNGNAVFFSTHVMEIAQKICDRIGIISKGKLIFIGTVDELIRNRGEESLEKVFLEVTGSDTEKMDLSYLDSN